MRRAFGLPGRLRGRLREGGHRRRLDLHHASRRASVAARRRRSLPRPRRVLEETGVYVPVCSDGGIVHDHHMTLALAMGADFLMLGRYFARFLAADPSSQHERLIRRRVLGLGIGHAPATGLATIWVVRRPSPFVEGVDLTYLPAGPLKDNVRVRLLRCARNATVVRLTSTSFAGSCQEFRLVHVARRGRRT